MSYNFQNIGLWSMNFGSWDLAADKSTIEIIKMPHKKPI
jgi:hypothetical protein